MREKRPTQVSRAVLSVVHPLDQPFQSSKTMISSKLLVFGIAFAFFTFLFVDFYQSHDGASNGRVGVNFSFDFYLEAVDGISADDVLNLPTYAQKFMCYLKLASVVSAYQTMDYTTESGFTQLCKNFTEVDKCYDNADPSSHQLCIVLESMYGRPYDCNIPIFKTVLRLCNSTYEDAMDIRNCYDNGMMQFSGSPDEAACRQKCCHDSSTFNASEPLLCGPGRDFLASVYCPNPVVDQTLKDNACQTSCAMEALTRYARNFCSDAALPMFMAYGKETMTKYLTQEKCFETCSGFGDD